MLIALGRDRLALVASYQYLIMGTIGATFFVIGVGLLYLMTGTLNIADMGQRIANVQGTRPVLAALAFLTVGVSLKLALFPLHQWLPNAYAFAPSAVAAFLAATATKVAVYVLLRFYFSVFGDSAVFAKLPMQQAMLLLMSAGSVLLITDRRKCSELGGLFHTMPLATVCGTIGALAISSFPLTSGFVSKSMVTQAAADGHLLTVWLLLTAAPAGVFLHAGIKFPWFVFFQKDSGLRPAEPPASMRWAMVFFAFLCIALGVWAEPLYALLPYAVKYEPYTWAHVLTQVQLLLFSGLAFFVMLPYLKRTLTITLDTDWVWRRLLPAAWQGMATAFAAAGRGLSGQGAKAGAGLLAAVSRHAGADARLARTWSTRAMAMSVLVLLLGYLALYYL